MSTWPFRVRRVQGAAVLATVGLVLALAQQPVRGAFNGSTSDTGNQVTTATTFCTSPGGTTVSAVQDSSVDQQNPSRVGGSDTYIVIVTQAGANRRGFVKFTLPSIPSRCLLSSARLRLYTDSADTGRTLGVYRAAGAWTEAALTWLNQPGVAGTPATTTTGAQNTRLLWDVTTLVGELYSGTDNGFVIKDQTEDGSGDWNQFQARQNANPPLLDVTWG